MRARCAESDKEPKTSGLQIYFKDGSKNDVDKNSVSKIENKKQKLQRGIPKAGISTSTTDSSTIC